MIAGMCPHTGGPLKPLRGPLEGFCISPEGVVYSQKARALQYDADYFLSEYRAQYGRSYFEDEPYLREQARRRLDLLGRVCPPPARMLEIGCAAGFFLDEARKSGYDVVGVEISKFAQDHASNTLGLDVRHGAFPDAAPAGVFDCIAAFYVLEHFQDQGLLFHEVASRIRPGGALLVALPSTNGPLFTTNQATWAKTHPVDHFADYSPRSLGRILPRYGLELVDVRPASYHPARMRGRPYWAWLPGLYRRWADRTAFGDTLEFTARRAAPPGAGIVARSD